ncbi:hypothetical protein DPMN_088546 [Dreissena polymorpha]|uniref:Uncharacterized protein n=1 Tax=Dreissena polymorpha TaxID=45954 RepID=A0A9D4KU98_DREPO|nr:hypothetical protein DPMN_088546 [Dreissena polymorpha]
MVSIPRSGSYLTADSKLSVTEIQQVSYEVIASEASITSRRTSPSADCKYGIRELVTGKLQTDDPIRIRRHTFKPCCWKTGLNACVSKVRRKISLCCLHRLIRDDTFRIIFSFAKKRLSLKTG